MHNFTVGSPPRTTRALPANLTAGWLPQAVVWAAAAGYLVVFCVVMRRGPYNTWAPLLVVPVLVSLTVPLILRMTRDEPDSFMRRLLLAALALKLLGTVARYVMAFGVYGGAADASSYDRSGAQLSQLYRDGDFTVDVGRVVGTNFLKLVTGVIYTFIGPSKLAGFFVFSWLSFLGLLLCYAAFRTALRGADHRRYAALILLMPSLAFWPSSIGKEAWMLLSLGLVAYGAARLLTRRRGGFAVFGVGVLAAAMVRPHVAIVSVVAVMAAYVFRRGRLGSGRIGGKVLGIAVLFAVASIVVVQAADFFNVERFDSDAVEQVFDTTETQTSQGGAAFQAPRARSPLTLPGAAVSVLFRPFLTEASNGPALIAALEGTLLLVVVLASWRRLAAVPRELFRRPYLLLCTVYSIAFIYAFSTLGNFAIVTRQRVQVFPFFLVLLALPPVTRRVRVEKPEAPLWVEARPVPAATTAAPAGPQPAGAEAASATAVTATATALVEPDPEPAETPWRTGRWPRLGRDKRRG